MRVHPSHWVDRLPILVSGFDTEQLLGMPKLLNSTGEAISHDAVTMLQEWKIQDRVKVLTSCLLMRTAEMYRLYLFVILT